MIVSEVVKCKQYDNNVKIKMTLTSPMCPVAGSLPPEVEGKVKAIPEVNDAKIELVWSPPWDKDMMSEVAKLELGFLWNKVQDQV